VGADVPIQGLVEFTTIAVAVSATGAVATTGISVLLILTFSGLGVVAGAVGLLPPKEVHPKIKKTRENVMSVLLADLISKQNVLFLSTVTLP